jgi:uncharacterized phage protein gp47/JayE
VIPGLDSVSAGEGWLVSLGGNTEEDGSCRERVKNRWRSQTLGDTKETYRFHAESVAGVKSAKIIRTPRGPGSTVCIQSEVNPQSGFTTASVTGPSRTGLCGVPICL